MAGLGLARLGKELKMLTDEPPPGVCAWPVDDCITHLQAQIQGPEDTPYERGTFLLDLQIPERYPFEPPKVRFVTPIYHPNIDSGGRICLDTLKMRPAGSWAPSMNVPTLLTTIRLLMAHPNGDDGLMPDITDLFLKNPSRFADVARAHVEQHARQDASGAASAGAASGRGSCSPRTIEDRKVGDARQTAGTLVEAASASAVDGKAELRSAGEDLREPATDAEDTPPSGVATTERPHFRIADTVATGTEKSAGDERDSSGVARKGTTTQLPDTGGEGSGSSKLSRINSSSSIEGGAEGAGADASSDDGEWSDSDEDDTEGRPDGKNTKRARTAP